MAELDFKKALTIKPKWGAALFCLGVNFEDKNMIDSAIYYHTAAITFDSSQYKAYNNLGNIYKNRKLYDLAIDYFTKALRILPSYTFALTNRAEAKYLKGDINGACKDLQLAISYGRTDKIEIYNRLCK